MEAKLAIQGGDPVTKEPFPTTIHGAEEIDEREIDAIITTLKQKKPFRFLHEAKDSKVSQLEAKFAEYMGCKHALAVTGGTTALISALVGLGIGSGDEVIVPGYTYIASAAAILAVRAIPVIVEIDNSLTINPKDIERKITEHTRGIMPVHMRGTPCRMDDIMDIARRHKLLVLEDVAQANGGIYKGKKLGSIGHAGAFSMQYYKLVTAGEGGMVITNDRVVYERATLQHDSAMVFWEKGTFTTEPFAGENYRMNELQGALGLVQFGRLDDILTKLRKTKSIICNEIKTLPGIELQDVPDPAGDCSVSLCFFCETSDKTRAFAEALRAEGIPGGSMFDKAIPDRHIYYYWDYVLNKHTADRNGCPWTCPFYKGNVQYSRNMCPDTLDYLSRTVVIPLGQKLGEKHINWIIQGITKVANALNR
ncbi:DegT/DnrJ/EryC1/StrS family aminotransferase [candidate division KSB1 bacterium]|nr:DegT/DnrJ/EryC1/StrS family aminotransferase [candidate division KSB1 bacterium]